MPALGNPLLFGRSEHPTQTLLHEEQRVKCLAMFKAVK